MKSRIIAFGILSLFLIIGCEQEDPPDNHDTDPIEFVSLTSGREIIFIEDTTMLKAVATGYELSFHWSVDKGDILGSGSEVTYVATPCTVGDNEIHCTVKSSNGKEETKDVIVTVL